MATSWKERKKKLQEKTRDSAENREGKNNTVLTFKNLKGREVLWIDKVKFGRDINEFDFIPFIVSTDWYARLKKFSGKLTGLEPGDVDYKLEYPRHNLPTGEKILCLREAFGEPCGVCEERERLMDEKDQEKVVEQLAVKWRCMYNIIDLGADEEIRLWDSSYHLFEKQILTEIHLGTGGLDFFWDIEDGKTVEWRGMQKKIGKWPFVEADRIDFKDRAPYTEAILDEVYPLDLMLVIPTYAQTVAVISGGAVPPDEQEETSSRPPRTSRAPAKEDAPKTRDRGRRFQEPEPEPEPQNKIDISHESCQKTFGVDFDQFPECEKCSNEDYNECQAVFENQTEPLVDPEPEPEPEPEPPARSRRTETSGRTRRRR